MDELDPPVPLLSSRKDVLRWVCGKTKRLMPECGDSPPLDGLSTYGRRDVDEVDTIIWLRVDKEIPPYNPRATPTPGYVSRGYLADVLRYIHWVGPPVYILLA